MEGVVRVVEQLERRAFAERLAHRLELIEFCERKSFGGRMTSQAQAEAPLEGVRGLIFLGFPLHPAGKPSQARAEHLARVAVPMLFLQGTRDAPPANSGSFGTCARAAATAARTAACATFGGSGRLPPASMKGNW